LTAAPFAASICWMPFASSWLRKFKLKRASDSLVLPAPWHEEHTSGLSSPTLKLLVVISGRVRHAFKRGPAMANLGPPTSKPRFGGAFFVGPEGRLLERPPTLP
jgi:hypothetical protein